MGALGLETATGLDVDVDLGLGLDCVGLLPSCLTKWRRNEHSNRKWLPVILISGEAVAVAELSCQIQSNPSRVESEQNTERKQNIERRLTLAES
jgi:hypothetical protein